MQLGRAVEHATTCFDADGDVLALSLAQPPAHGTVAIVTTPYRGLKHTAAKDFLGDDPISLAAGRTKLRVKLTRKARRALRGQGRRATTVRLSAAVTDGAGNRRVLPARVVVR